MPRSDASLLERLGALDRVRKAAAWRLLRSDSATAVLSILRANFIETGESSVFASVLADRLDDDLEVLRIAGVALERTARQYLSNWVTEGYLERRIGGSGAEESYELSADALAAIRITDDLVAPPRAVTESRLATVMDLVQKLAVDTDPSVASRLAALELERAALDARIDATREGRADVISVEAAIEQVRDILQLADQLPADFARVRRDVESLNVEFRRSIIESDGSRGEVLDTLFRGVDVLADDEAGRSFNAFYSLLVDLERSAGFDRAIDAVLSRESIRGLTSTERGQLRSLVERLTSRGGEVHDVYVSLARSLRTFVQAREFVEERRVSRLLKHAQRAFGEVSGEGSLLRSSGFTLDLSKSRIRSVSQFSLIAPDAERPLPVLDAEVTDVDVEALRAMINESDINLFELRRNIDQVLEKRSIATMNDVLAEHPASQGFGSVVGLLYIALERAHTGEAMLVETERATVRWGAGLGARVPSVFFTRRGETAA